MHDETISSLREELKQHVDQKNHMNYHRFFKEEVLCYGVKTRDVRDISRRSFILLKGMGKQEIFSLCERLLASDFCEEAFIASDWAYRLRREFEPGDLAVFESWIGKYINNWAKCDTFCNHTLGAFVERFPASIGTLKAWTGSGNRWFPPGFGGLPDPPCQEGHVPPRGPGDLRSFTRGQGRHGAEGMRVAAQGSQPNAREEGI